MIKSFNIKPHSSYHVFQYFTDYPYNIFPDILFVYPYRNIILSYEVLCTLFSGIINNTFIFKFNKNLEIPIQIFIHTNENVKKTYYKTKQTIKNILYYIFPDDLIDIILTYFIKLEFDINEWKIDKKLAYSFTNKTYSFRTKQINGPKIIYYSDISRQLRILKENIIHIDCAFFEKNTKRLLYVNKTHFNYNRYIKKLTILENMYIILVIYTTEKKRDIDYILEEE